MPEQPTYIVTGGAGFVGANLVAALLAGGTGDPPARPHIIVIDTFRSGSFANIVEACQRRGAGPFDGEVIAGSASRVDFDRLMGGGAGGRVAALFHLGAITDTTVTDEAEMIRENVDGFGEMLRACAWRGVPLVYASSAATYGSPPQARDRIAFPLEAAGHPNNVYGFSKWLMECEHRRFEEGERAGTWGHEPTHIVGLRYFNVFGPGESRKGRMASMVYQLARQIMEGKRPRVFVDGSQARDQVYVDDVVECTIRAAAPGITSGIYNLGSGTVTSFNEIVAALRQGLGISESELPTEYFDMPAEIREFYQDYTCADLSETEGGLGWRPKWKPPEAIAEYAAWLTSTRAFTQSR
jgi:ADP-L-glycero-D-manno-heptose 6-epimerase